MPDKYSDVVSQAAEDNWIYHRGSAEHAKYIRHYHIMNYDYTASDDPVESCAHLCLSHFDLRPRTSLVIRILVPNCDQSSCNPSVSFECPWN